jgi:hypothetical protein
LKIPKGESEAVSQKGTDNTMVKRKGTNHDLQNITEKPKDRAKRTQLKTGDELGCSERVSSSSSTFYTRRVTVK